MSEHINPELHRGEKLIQFNNLEVKKINALFDF